MHNNRNIRNCAYSFKTIDPDRFYCINNKLIHTGTVHKTICERCPFCVSKKDIDAELRLESFLSKNPQSVIHKGCCGKDTPTLSTMNTPIQKNQKVFDLVPKIDLSTCNRHLTYHIWPTKHHDFWKHNLDELEKYWSLFNGRKIVSIVYDKNTHGPDTVTKELERKRLNFDHQIVKRNNTTLRESLTWLTMLDTLQLTSMTNQDVIFTAHAKGVRHEHVQSHIANWANCMYYALLHNWEEVKVQLETHLAVGIFRRFNAFNTPTNFCWHFSGTFFWWRPYDIVQRGNYRTVDQAFYGTESWLGHQMPPEYSTCLFEDNCQDLYHNHYWKDFIIPKWIAQYGTETGIIT